MNLKRLIQDDSAVSPVIGVILMVAITVILAAVIGTFVLGLGDQVGNNAPQASWDFEQKTVTLEGSDGADSSDFKVVEITHSGGDSIDYGNLQVEVNGNPAFDVDDSGSNDDVVSIWSGTGTISAGSKVRVALYDTGSPPSISDGNGFDDDGSGAYSSPSNAKALSSDNTIRLVWTSSSGDSSSVIGTYTVN